MAVLGVVALAVGLILLIAEAHVPLAGVFAGLGAVAAATGLGLLLADSGASLWISIGAAAVGAGAAAAVLIVTVPRVAAARREPVQAGPQRLPGSIAVVRSWEGERGQVQADGGLWGARLADREEQQDTPAPGEAVIVLDIRGLTLTVRRCEPWEVELL